MEKEFDIIVVGAGAAGLIAAGRAAELGHRVLLLEKMERPGRKLLITGKGRCNITNQAPISEFLKHIQPNPRFLKNAFSQFFNTNIIELLEKYGVATVTERGERVFPETNSAAQVLEALIKYTTEKKVEIRCHHKVEKLFIENERVTGIMVMANGIRSKILCHNVIVCTGGCSYPATGSDGDGFRFAKSAGHTISNIRPALVPVETEGKLAEKLQGLSLRNVNATVWVDGKKHKEAFGEMLFAHFGLTGPIILSLSRYIIDQLLEKRKVEVSIDLKPALDHPKLDARLLRDINEHGKKKIDNAFKLWLPSKMVPVFIETLGINPEKECHQFSAAERKKTLLLLKDLRFTISGYRSFKEAIITAGGVQTDEIEPGSMASKKIKGLSFAGEVIDLDADTGGYNLQIAWSTGWVAGTHANINE